MNLLPIVERELRVSARRGTTHWTRFGPTLVLALATISSFATAGSPSVAVVAKSAFAWLIGSAFVLACAACTLTADTLSGESREGTLGLLFLTNLRTWDLTLGKLVSSGLGALYVGLALVPVLMLPVLAGGVSGPEAGRSGITLLAIILVGLTAGLAASARDHERGRALRRAGLWMTGTVVLPWVVGWFVPGPWIEALSPMTTLRLAQDLEYRAAPMMFWISLTLQLAHAALLLLKAGSRLRRQISDSAIEEAHLGSEASKRRKGEPDYSIEPHSNASYLAANGPVETTPRPQGQFDEVRPLEWLVRRQRGQNALCWVAALTFVFSGSPFLLVRFLPLVAGSSLTLGFYTIYQLSWVGDALLAWAACRFFFEGRRSGELELLLTTPAGAHTLVSAHWAAMKRLLRWPGVVVIVPLLLQSFFLAVRWATRAGWAVPGPPRSYELYSALYTFFRAVDLLLLVVAMNWLGMLFGLTMRRQVSAVGLTMALAAGLPVLLRSVFQLVLRQVFPPNIGSAAWMVSMLGNFPIGWALLLFLTFLARQRLRQGNPADLFQVDWRQTTKDSIRKFTATGQKLRWLTPVG